MDSDDDQEDVRKITEFINRQKSSYTSSYQECDELEFQDFLSFKNSPDEDDEPEEKLEDTLISNNSEIATQVPVTALTEEERSTIENCADPELKQLLILNRTKNMQLVQLHRKIKQLFLECEKVVDKKSAALMKLEEKQSLRNNQYASVWRLSAPYFKDKNFFTSPLNEDAIKKRRRNELLVYDLTSPQKWTTIEFDRLISAIKCNYNINRQNDILNKIKTLKLTSVKNEDKEAKADTEEIIRLTEELDVLKNGDVEDIPPLGSDKFINWNKVAEIFLKDKRTSTECRSVWHILVHPEINKSAWTLEENNKLEEIAKDLNYQNWDLIAQLLNTKRTGFTVCLHYFSKLCVKFKKNKFTPEEDKQLLDVIETYRLGNFIPWNKVICHFTDRSRHQLYQRYVYFLSKRDVKKGKFSEAEDILLIILVNRFGRNFKICEQYMPHRSQIQLKSRYNTNLQRKIKKGCFTADDDEILYKHVEEFGTKSWTALSEKLQRCGAQIRQRYRLIKTFLQENPNAGISDIPRRKSQSGQKSDDLYTFLNYMAQQFEDSEAVPTLQMIEESLQDEVKLTKTKPVKNDNNTSKNVDGNVKSIDSLLTDFFANSLKIKQHNSIGLSSVQLDEAAENIAGVLSTLKVNLDDIPQNYKFSPNLDNIDSEILERLINKKLPGDSNSQIETLLPPNMNTLVGLRSLLIKHKDFKVTQKNNPSRIDNIIWSMAQNLITMENVEREDVLHHRELFLRRFDALFSWSAILSLEKPNCSTENDDGNATESAEVASGKRTYQNKSGPAAKKLKVDVSTLTNLAQNQQSTNNASSLQLVDKAVLDKLLTSKNNLNIIKIETITGIDGVVRPILKKAVVEDAGPLKNPVNGNAKEQEENLADIAKLDMILKSEQLKQLLPGHAHDDLASIREDVELLDEILQYDRIKADPDAF